MSINPTSQLHAAEPENTLVHATRKAPGGEPRANAAEIPAGTNSTQKVEQTQAASVAENNAGREQGAQKNGGQGGRINLYA